MLFLCMYSYVLYSTVCMCVTRKMIAHFLPGDNDRGLDGEEKRERETAPILAYSDFGEPGPRECRM